MKTSELTGRKLDYAVALALGYKYLGPIGVNYENKEKPFCLSGCNEWWESPKGEYVCGPCFSIPERYSSEWDLGGPLIEKYRIRLFPGKPDEWIAQVPSHFDPEPVWFGGSPLEAACRALVAYKLGPEVSIPEELEE